MIYLDNSATTQVFDGAAERMLQIMRNQYFNPSAAYGPAVQCEREVEAARARLLSCMGHPEGELIFTSGGTESNNAAILGTLATLRKKHRIITSLSEHPSVFNVYRQLEERGQAEVVYLSTTSTGEVDPQSLSAVLTPDTALVSLMHVNNETGAVTDLQAIKNVIARQAPEARFHVDGVQAFCRLPFTPLPCDFYAISGHKFHAPKGIGALYIKKGTRFSGGQIGGGQEKGLRSGTLNSPGILGMDTALETYAAHQNQWLPRLRAMKVRLAENLLQLDGVCVNGPAPELGAPHILNLSFPGVRGEVLLHALEAKGILVSTGSACSSHKRGKNRVLDSLGISPARQESAIRFSLCPMNTLEQMDEASNVIFEQVRFLRKYQRR